MPQPGWYPDPAVPGRLRWWDGRGWTDSAQPVPVFPLTPTGGLQSPPYAPPPVIFNPVKDLAEEARWARLASISLIAGAAGYVVILVLEAFMMSAYAGYWSDMFNPASSTWTYSSVPELPVAALCLSMAINLVDAGLLVVGVLFLIWFYNAALVAQRAGLPARRSPGWAVGGFIIPIVCLWFPYQSTVDMFPASHPGRAMVRRWWALWIGVNVIALIMYVVSFFSVVVAVALALAGGVLAILAAVAARSLIAEIGRVHADLVHGGGTVLSDTSAEGPDESSAD